MSRSSRNPGFVQGDPLTAATSFARPQPTQPDRSWPFESPSTPSPRIGPRGAPMHPDRRVRRSTSIRLYQPVPGLPVPGLPVPVRVRSLRNHFEKLPNPAQRASLRQPSTPLRPRCNAGNRVGPSALVPSSRPLTLRLQICPKYSSFRYCAARPNCPTPGQLCPIRSTRRIENHTITTARVIVGGSAHFDTFAT